MVYNLEKTFISSIQTAILSFIATVFGIKLARRLNLKLYAKTNNSNLTKVILISLFAALFITLSDKYIFSPVLYTEGLLKNYY